MSDARGALASEANGVDRVIAPNFGDGDGAEAALRPQRLAEFVGQKATCDNLRVFIEAARARREAPVIRGRSAPAS